MPLAWWSFGRGPAQAGVAAAIVVLSVVSFVRMGRDRWFGSILFGVLKGLGLTVGVLLAGLLGGNLVAGVGVLAAMNTP